MDTLANSIVPIGLYIAFGLFAIGGVVTGVGSVESFRFQSAKSMPSPIGLGVVSLVSLALAYACWIAAR